MNLEISLPKNLENEYQSIEKEFAPISTEWEKYSDEIIPQDDEYAKRIIKFLIEVIDYTLANFENINVKKYQKFIGYYHLNFEYGPNADFRNYLDFDQGSIRNVFDFFMDEEYEVTKTILKKKKDELKKILNDFPKN